MKIKQASMYLRVLWLNDNENLRPDDLYVHVEGDIVEETTFTITSTDNNVGNNSPWENVTGWANGITYNYQKEQQEASETDIEEPVEVSNIPYVIPSVVNIPTNYRCNILKNAETEEYSYYTIKMTYVPPKKKKMARIDWNVGIPDTPSSTPTLNFNGTQIENVNFNGTQIDKVVYNGVTVFEKQQTAQPFKDIILANSTLNEGTPNFSLTATTDEGMFETDDPIYGEGAKSQYFRGAVTNNYVKFANYWWRIIRINGDGTVRLIYDGTIGHQNGESSVNRIYETSIYTTGKISIGDALYINSTLKNNADSFYINKLQDFENFISNNKFYNDTSNYASSTGSVFRGQDRLKSNSPSLTIGTGMQHELSVGVITGDEIMLAGSGKIGLKNSSYYLYINQAYWSMTPYSYNSSTKYVYVFSDYGDGGLFYKVVSNSLGLRPVINLKADVQVTGTGTIDDPYVVVGAE